MVDQLRFSDVHFADPPDIVPKQTWAAALEVAWAQVQVPQTSSTQEEWLEFCSKAECAQERALQACGVEIPRPRASCPKGSEMQVVAAEPATFRLQQHASMHELKIRKLLGKVREALRQQQAGQQVPNVLLQRIRRHPFVVQHSISDLESIQNQAVRELQRHAQHSRSGEAR